MTALVLASASPRRAELLQQIGMQFDVCAAHIDETPHEGEQAENYVLRMAIEKAQAIKPAFPDCVVIASDTSVVVDGEVLGKPVDFNDAQKMLRQLAGRAHVVMTSVCVMGTQQETCLNQTEVWFRAISDEEILAYWQTGEPGDKAGAYAIQGVGAKFVERIHGSYSGVMGLPLFEVSAMLERMGVVASS